MQRWGYFDGQMLVARACKLHAMNVSAWAPTFPLSVMLMTRAVGSITTALGNAASKLHAIVTPGDISAS